MVSATRARWIPAVFFVLLAATGCNPDAWYSGGDFLATGRTLSTFTAVQVDPRAEDSAGPQFVVAADLDGNGRLDLVSAWNQSEPVQIHLQRAGADGGIVFETITLAGSIPVVSVAGLAVADFDVDGRLDVAVLVKQSLLAGAACLNGNPSDAALSGLIIVYFGPADARRVNQALAWEEVAVGVSLLAGAGVSDALPEEGGYTSFTVGDVGGDGAPDIVAAWNSACELDGSEILLFTNLGRVACRDGTWRVEPVPDGYPQGSVKSVALADIDGDGDLDVLATRPDAGTMNVRWFRNPRIDVVDDYHVSDGAWHVGIVGQLATEADIMRVGDMDRDGIADVVVRSTDGAIIQWYKGPQTPTSEPVRNIPWQVYTLAEFTQRPPEAIALGDLNFDGYLEVIVGAQGGLAFFDSQTGPSVYDQWLEDLVIDDVPADENSNVPATTDPNVAPQQIAGGTSMNSIIVADLDGDGANDIIVTLDRSGLSGLSNDALVWFRNTRRPPR
ncbi:MAG TPA: VCBS repeat-containing protein [Phycisphaerae bacterium]|nr:VCBS repeat-containing protein [Phycisphaerae bacterium]HNU43868.1 VCBS repeat-containing protein [Phycisphaerae bacterium]